MEKTGNGYGGCLGVFVIACIVIFIIVSPSETPERRKQRLERETVEQAEKRRKGWHCLSAWDSSHSGVERYLKQRLRDPDSYEHVDTRITPVSNGEHTLIMRYRARNGFGGMTVGMVTARINNATCNATMVSKLD